MKIEPEDIVKTCDGLLKGLTAQDIRRVKNYLIVKYCGSWLPQRKIAELTKVERSMVTTDLKSIRKDKYLLGLADELDSIFKIRLES